MSAKDILYQAGWRQRWGRYIIRRPRRAHSFRYLSYDAKSSIFHVQLKEVLERPGQGSLFFSKPQFIDEPDETDTSDRRGTREDLPRILLVKELLFW